eukprot:9119019-Alexandrium_andersonii.AAC.1
MARRPTSAQTRYPELSRGTLCVFIRAKREYGNENLPGTPQNSFSVVVRAGCGGGIDNAGDGGGIKE